jgi:hypothetical protein
MACASSVMPLKDLLTIGQKYCAPRKGFLEIRPEWPRAGRKPLEREGRLPLQPASQVQRNRTGKEIKTLDGTMRTKPQRSIIPGRESESRISGVHAWWLTVAR